MKFIRTGRGGRKSSRGGGKGDKEGEGDKSSEPAAAHGGSANDGPAAAAAFNPPPPPGPKAAKTYVDMRVGNPVLLYNGSLVATTSMAAGCPTKYTKNVRVPKTNIQTSLDGNSREALLVLIEYIQGKAQDFVNEVSDEHDLLFLTETAVPQDLNQAHPDKVSKFNPKVVVKVIDHIEGGLAIDIPGICCALEKIIMNLS